eukprot:351226-Chlamydomonas_euryale.AAC.10
MGDSVVDATRMLTRLRSLAHVQAAIPACYSPRTRVRNTPCAHGPMHACCSPCTRVKDLACAHGPTHACYSPSMRVKDLACAHGPTHACHGCMCSCMHLSRTCGLPASERCDVRVVVSPPPSVPINTDTHPNVHAETASQRVWHLPARMLEDSHAHTHGLKDLGCRVHGLKGLGFRVHGLKGLGFRVHGLTTEPAAKCSKCGFEPRDVISGEACC